jgi:hypothetical protein
MRQMVKLVRLVATLSGLMAHLGGPMVTWTAQCPNKLGKVSESITEFFWIHLFAICLYIWLKYLDYRSLPGSNRFIAQGFCNTYIAQQFYYFLSYLQRFAGFPSLLVHFFLTTFRYFLIYQLRFLYTVQAYLASSVNCSSPWTVRVL